MIIIIAVFLIPNLLPIMLAVATTTAAAFIGCAFLTISNITKTQLVASIVYLLMEILICAVFALYFKRYQRGEYNAKEEVKRIYSIDLLTKVGNRIKLEEEAERWMEFCVRHNLELSMVLIDIDNMKKFNDEYGHLTGDTVLYETAQIIQAQLRKNDVCVRWGGDEFILLLPYTNTNEAMALSEDSGL